MITIKPKTIYEKFDTIVKTPPILNVQIWDNDSLSADDFLGATSINLSHLPEPAVASNKCVLNKKTKNFTNLFQTKTVKGWFPCQGSIDGKITSLGQTVSCFSINTRVV